VTLTFKRDLDSVKTNQHAKVVIVQKTHTRLFAQPGPLNWLVNAVYNLHENTSHLSAPLKTHAVKRPGNPG